MSYRKYNLIICTVYNDGFISARKIFCTKICNTTLDYILSKSIVHPQTFYSKTTKLFVLTIEDVHFLIILPTFLAPLRHKLYLSPR